MKPAVTDFARDVAQVPTVRVPITTFMRTPEFARGFADVRAGIPLDWRVGSTDPDAAWAYERGRLLAHIAPLNMPLRIGCQLNPKAVSLYGAAIARKLII
jgi:hypothetical protein